MWRVSGKYLPLTSPADFDLLIPMTTTATANRSQLRRLCQWFLSPGGVGDDFPVVSLVKLRVFTSSNDYFLVSVWIESFPFDSLRLTLTSLSEDSFTSVFFHQKTARQTFYLQRTLRSSELWKKSSFLLTFFVLKKQNAFFRAAVRFPPQHTYLYSFQQTPLLARWSLYSSAPDTIVQRCMVRV